MRSVKKARAYARGEAKEGFVAHVPGTVDVRAIRSKTGLTQMQFALRYGFTSAALRDWEQGRRKPEATARVLLLVIDKHPEAVEDALSAA
nr:transcriptional regulator [Roseomonas rubea]